MEPKTSLRPYLKPLLLLNLLTTPSHPPPPPPRTRAKPPEKRKHLHYWEHVPAIAEVLRKGKHLEGKEEKPRYDRGDPLEKALVRRAWELIERLESRWTLELGELPEGNYRRLIFGAIRHRNGKRRTYDLGGWGRFAQALGKVLEELGHKVLYPKTREELACCRSPWGRSREASPQLSFPHGKAQLTYKEPRSLRNG